METKIRLSRTGGKKKAFYRIVVSAIASKRDGKSIENLGSYDPAKGIGKALVNKERVQHWIGRGARPTNIVKQIMKQTSTTQSPALTTAR